MSSGPSLLKGEAARGIVELGRGDAEIEGHPVDRVHPPVGEQAVHLAEAAGKDAQAAVEVALHLETAGDGGGIAVDPPHGAARRLEEGAAIAPTAEGAVDIDAAVARGQELEHFAEQHRDMPARYGTCGQVLRCRHGAPPPFSPPGPAAGPLGARTLSVMSLRKTRSRAAAQ